MECSLSGVTNQRVVDEADIIVLVISFKHTAPTRTPLTGFEGKIAVSPINPIERTNYFYYAPPPEGSAAMMVKGMLPENATVCAAFNNITANKWKVLDEEFDYSVTVCCDDGEAKQQVIEIANNTASDAVLHNSDPPTPAKMMPDAPSAPSRHETNVGDTRTRILVTGVYIIIFWSASFHLILLVLVRGGSHLMRKRVGGHEGKVGVAINSLRGFALFREATLCEI